MDWAKLLNKDRPRKSTNPGDHRAEFERDFDRAIFSTPVKRLQDKAQVFPLEPHDAVRTRLTHSLEVSSVARGLAAHVAKWLLLKKEIRSGMEHSIEVISATCGLIHDLGNPPFGHAGEDAMRQWFQKTSERESLKEKLTKKPQLVQDFQKFDGNAQSLRLVGTLQILSDYHGLNLTYATLSASCKYVAQSNKASKNASNRAMSKPGYFASENHLVAEIRKNTGTGIARNPICFLVEAADDIVNSVADIEDAVKKGIITWKTLEKEISSTKRRMAKKALERTYKILRAGTRSIPNGLADDVYAAAFRTAVIGMLVPSVGRVFTRNYGSIISGTYPHNLVDKCNASSLIEWLQGVGRDRVYCTHPTLKLEIMGRKIIMDLMDIFWEGSKYMPATGQPETKEFPGKICALISENYRRVFQNAIKKNEFPETYHRLQLVMDQVCGMTDSFAKRLHAELTN